MVENMWMVRAGRGGILIEDFETKEVVAIGWAFMGDLNKVRGKEDIAKLVEGHEENYSKGKTAIVTGQIYRFKFELSVGDYIVTYNPNDRIYLAGKIIGDDEFSPDFNPEYPHIRKVKWDTKINRDNLSATTKNFLSAYLTLFKIYGGVRDEILKFASGLATPLPKDEEEASEDNQLKLENLESQAHELIKDKISALNWDQMEILAEGLLKAMGYKTRLTPKGSDLGRDIIASQDGLGLVGPRIIAEVKHRRANRMGAREIRSFIGGLRSGDKGLYISTGGFSKEGRYEAERSTVPVTLLDFDDVVDLFEEYYERLTPEIKALVPLKRFYWPVS